MIRLALLPVFVLGLYVYFRDANREPLLKVMKAFVGGILVVPLVLLIHAIFPIEAFCQTPFLQAFVSAALVEEGGKLLILMLLMWKDVDFDEPFDGIVYAAMVGLGFAFVEDVMYIYESSDPYATGIMRAFTSVPAHFFFALIMGYQFGLARFVPLAYRPVRLLMALVLPLLFHGIYDFLLMQAEWLQQHGDAAMASTLMTMFFVFDILLWRVAVKRIRKMRKLQ